MSTADHLIALRRDLHRHPEPAWREFYTTSRLVDEIERIGVDELYLGSEAIDGDTRWGVPEDAAELERWRERARADGANEEALAAMGDGHTGIVAVLDRGEGPHVALRVDIDALVREESGAPEHLPAAEGFRSERDGHMHACGHDAHATIGIGVLEELAASEFTGRMTVCFQPAEEEIGGGLAAARSGHLDDVDHLLAVHVGLGYETGEVVAGFDGFLAVTNLFATFRGEPAHAGSRPQEGKNAMLAMSAAIQHLYAISRHSAGSTRVNVGTVAGGSASNIIPEEARLAGEVRGGTTALREYMKERAMSVLDGAAAMYACDVDVRWGAEAPSARSDPALAGVVAEVAEAVDGVETVHPSAQFSGSEDATYLMRHVQERGGEAAYVGIGTDHPGGHHTATFDVDEESIRIGVDVLAGTLQSLLGETTG